MPFTHTAYCIGLAIRCKNYRAAAGQRRMDRMSESSNNRSPNWLWICIIWIAGGLFDASQSVLVMRAEGAHHPWLPVFTSELGSWLPWVLATPLLSSLARRFPIVRSTSIQTVVVHGAAFSIISLVGSAWSAMLLMLVNPWEHLKAPGPFVDLWSSLLLDQMLTFLIVYALIIAVTIIMDSRASIARQQISVMPAHTRGEFPAGSLPTGVSYTDL